VIEFETVKSIHDFELSRKAEFERSLAFPLSIVALLSASMAFVMEKVGRVTLLIEFSTPVFVLECLLFVSAACALFATLFFIAWAYHRIPKGYEFASLPFADDIEKYLRQFDQLPIDVQEVKAKDLIMAYYVEVASINAAVNDYRTGRLHRAKVSLLFATFAVLTFDAIAVGVVILKN
jgi:hypothetical protein